MSVRKWAAERLFGAVIEEKVAERLKAASATDKEDAGWRRLTGNSNRNLSPLTQDRMHEIAFWLSENNPLAKWIIDTIKNFLLSEGLPYEAEDEAVKAALDDFWFDPLNRMDLYLEKHVKELEIFGELCFPVFTAEQTGKVRLGYIDPADIKKVVTDPDNVKMTIGVVLKDASGQEGRKLKVILPEGADQILSPAAQQKRDSFTDGECFFFAINNLTNSPRGRSTLLPTADWLDGYEQFLFDYSDKWPLLNSFVWDLKVENATPEEIDKHVKNFTKKSGSVFGHNEKVSLAASTPDLKAVDAEAGARLLRNHILGHHNFPEHWFGGGGDVNRATAVEMGTPAFKALSAKQQYMKFILEFIFRIVIERRRAARYLNVTDEAAGAYSVTTPEIASKDISKYSAVIQQVSASLMTAELQGWIDKDTARRVFALTMGYLGIELDLESVKQAVEDEAANKGYDDYKDGKKETPPVNA